MDVLEAERLIIPLVRDGLSALAAIEADLVVRRFFPEETETETREELHDKVALHGGPSL